MSSSGWEGAARVPTEDGRDWVRDGADVAGPRVSGFAWPSEENPAVWVEAATREEAATVATFARAQLVEWLAGGGLHPVAVCYRWVIACCFLRIEMDADLVRGLMKVHNTGLGLGKWERLVMEQIKPGRPWRETLRRVDEALDDAERRGRYARWDRPDERSIADVLDWVESESLEAPLDWDDEQVGALEADAREVGRASMRLLCRWLLESGPGLLSVLQRFYALVYERYKLLAGGMTGEDFSSLVLQVRGTFCEEMKRFFSDPGVVLLGYVPKTAGQKSPEASAVYAANAARHKPRRQLGGGAALERGEREAEAAAETAAASARERAAAELAEDWAAAESYVAHVGEESEWLARHGELSQRRLEFVERLRAREAREFCERVRKGA